MSQILALTDEASHLATNRKADKTHWVIFVKGPANDNRDY
nr:Uncharacterised protein [Klebsiella pneumoniae]